MTVSECNSFDSYSHIMIDPRAGAGATMSRMGMFEAGLPETVPVYAVNRQCASGLQAIASVAASISR